MSLLGTAALAMWWDIAPEVRADFAHWHAHEHFPERLALPGFLRATRWQGADGAGGMFVLYELADHAVLSSPAYAARLNAPSAWSTRLMPHHRHMVRSQCRVVGSRGLVTAAHALTVRIGCDVEAAPRLQAALLALTAAAEQPGLVGVHVLQHQAPPLAATTEQRLRGLADRAADGVLVATGYDADRLDAFADEQLGEAALAALGARGSERQLYTLACSATPTDIA